MKRTIRMLAAPAAALLILAGCGGGDDQAADEPTTAEEAPAEETDDEVADDESDAWPIVEDEDGNVVENPEDEPMDTFSLTEEPLFVSTATGASITMTMDAQPDADEQIAWLEQYRQDAGGDPVTYILSEVDNRDGSEPVNMYAVDLYDAEGAEYICEMPDDYVEANWRPVWMYGATDEDEYESADGEPMDYDTADELDRRYNEHEIRSSVSPLEQNTLVTICPADLPEEVTGVYVMPGGVYIEPTYATPISYEGEDG